MPSDMVLQMRKARPAEGDALTRAFSVWWELNSHCEIFGNDMTPGGILISTIFRVITAAASMTMTLNLSQPPSQSPAAACHFKFAGQGCKSPPPTPRATAAGREVGLRFKRGRGMMIEG
eukprot:2466197-Rhodomonas_salina.3